MSTFIVSGTDTDVGKTVFAAALTLGIGAAYWKPIQSGVADGTDCKTIKALTGLDEQRVLAEEYVLTEPLSPHRSAELDGVSLDVNALVPPESPDGRPLVIEGAGGLLVPVTRETLFIEIFKKWGAPVVLCARTTLGTINHTLMSVEALKRRDIPLLGIAFVGHEMPDNERTICDFAGAKKLGRLPMLDDLSPSTLRQAFAAGFDAADFGGAHAD
jgi:dethiobiotin synthetase